MLLSVAVVAGVAIIALTAAITAMQYASLPERVPIHLSIDGTPDGYGPRPMIWFIVGTQVFCIVLFVLSGMAIAGHAPGTHGSLAGLPVFAVCILALLWRGQVQLLAAAKSATPVPMLGLWVFLAASLAIGILALSVL
jgi:hypothetical protein